MRESGRRHPASPWSAPCRCLCHAGQVAAANRSVLGCVAPRVTPTRAHTGMTPDRRSSGTTFGMPLRRSALAVAVLAGAALLASVLTALPPVLHVAPEATAAARQQKP